MAAWDGRKYRHGHARLSHAGICSLYNLVGRHPYEDYGWLRTGSVGAGVSDDGADEYYTLIVRQAAVAMPTNRPGGKADPKATPTKIIPIVPLLTVTPRSDRWIIHTVGLWAVTLGSSNCLWGKDGSNSRLEQHGSG